MKLFYCALALSAALLAFGSTPSHAYHRPGGVVAGEIVVPPEWAGIWQYTDTTYDCTGAFKSTDSGFDTLCAGTRFDTTSTVSCTGSATSTTFTQHCTSSGELFPDCNYTLDINTHGTRTGDTFFSVSVISQDISGTAKGCDFFPDSCSQINQHSTRIGPAPPEYCATPAAPTTWGKLKASYR